MKLPIRSQICAPPGRSFLSIDLKQAEGWVVAYLANEPTMKLELQFGDIHTRTARYVLDIPVRDLLEEERYTGKKCNHAFNYMMGPERAAEVINKEGQVTVTVKQTKIYRKKYLELYRIENWWLDVENRLRETGTLITPYGFERRFYGIGKERVKEGVANLPQSTIADHMYGKVQKEDPHEGGLIKVYWDIVEPSRKSIRIVQSAHDSAIFECPEGSEIDLYHRVKKWIVRPMIINGEQFTIPMDGKWGKRWEEFTKIKEN